MALTDEQGTVTDTWEDGDFGETTRVTGSSYNPYLYTGQQFDPEFGGHYFLRARLYHPQYGRFLSRDPIGWEGGSNVFVYCDNNPLNFSDPSGLDPYGWGPSQWKAVMDADRARQAREAAEREYWSRPENFSSGAAIRTTHVQDAVMLFSGPKLPSGS